MFFWVRMEVPNLATWTFLKLRKMGSCILRQVPLIMPVLRCGKINHTIQNLISGHLVVWYTKWQLWNLHLELKIWMAYSKKSLKAHIRKLVRTFQKAYLTQLNRCFRSIPQIDPLRLSFLKVSHPKCPNLVTLVILTLKPTPNCYKLFVLTENFTIWLIDYQNQTIITDINTKNLQQRRLWLRVRQIKTGWA